MFPSLRSPRNIMGNDVSALMFPRLPGPSCKEHVSEFMYKIFDMKFYIDLFFFSLHKTLKAPV